MEVEAEMEEGELEEKEKKLSTFKTSSSQT